MAAQEGIGGRRGRVGSWKQEGAALAAEEAKIP